MVCPRCISAVAQLLKDQNLQANYVRLGEVELNKDPGENKLKQFADDLKRIGLELLDDNRKQLIEKIKNTIITQVHHTNEETHHNFSEILSKTLHKDYSYLSGLFSAVEGITIEKYIINQKIERVKELIIYDELNLSEIAYKLGYSSVAHLSNQFKKVTGLTPTHFKKVGQNIRKTLDSI